MKNLKKLFFLCVFVFSIGTKMFAWPGMPLPKLHVDGRNLKDPCGNSVLLHGVAITPSPWFNGCQYGSTSGYCTWENYNVQGCLNYNFSVMDKLTDTSDGWHLNYIRLHIDPYWTNDPGSPIAENDISRFNYSRLVKYTDEVIIPLVEHARERGMYVILRPPGVCPEKIAVNDYYHTYLKTVWGYLSKHPSLKNADHVMFELANEPVQILGVNGNWGATEDEHFAALKNFFQPLVDMIRNNGANNICWIPGTGWQSHYQGYVNHPITGGDIGYAVHIYPAYWGGIRNYSAFLNGWNTNVKPIADIAPIVVTETDWAPDGYGTFGIANTGTAGGDGFGANLNHITYLSGNVSWNVLCPDNLLDHGNPNGGIAYGGNWQACAAPVKHWFAEFSKVNIPSMGCGGSTVNLVDGAIYEIEFNTDASKVLDLYNGEDSNGAVIRPFSRNGATAQQWIAIDAGNGYWRFKSNASSSGRVIDLSAGNTSNGTAIQLWDNYSNDAQTWQVVDAGNGYFKILSKINTSKSWDAANCVVDGSEPMQLWDSYGTSCQLFKFNSVGLKSAGIEHNIQEQKQEDEYVIYPNPSIGGDFRLVVSEDQNINLSIYSISGVKVYTQGNLCEGENVICSNLEPGIYIVQLSNSKEVTKLIVK